jgi:hypothetical protein
MEKWAVRNKSQSEDTSSLCTIGCDGPVNWFDVRSFADKCLSFGIDDHVTVKAAEDAQADYVVRWTGYDAGPNPTRRMQYRAVLSEEWKDV